MLTDVVVFQKCKRCGVTLECVFDPGFAGDRWQPPEPAYWYSRTEEIELVPMSDQFVESEYCDHEGGYSKADMDEFQASCDRIADQSFEFTQSDFDWGYTASTMEIRATWL